MFGIWFNRRPDSFRQRPDIDSQNTGHMALERMPIPLTSVNGRTGFNYHFPIRALQPAGLVAGQSLKLNDLMVTGNAVQQSLHINPLSDDNSTAF